MFHSKLNPSELSLYKMFQKFFPVVVSGGKASVEGSSTDIFEMLADKANYPVSASEVNPGFQVWQDIFLSLLFKAYQCPPAKPFKSQLVS